MIKEILILLFKAGLKCDHRQLRKIYDYTLAMIRDSRAVMFYKDKKLIGIAYFSVCNSIDSYQDKPLWQYIPHNPAGEIVFIEKVVALKWNKHLRDLLEAEIAENYKNAKIAVAYRPSPAEDRQRIYKPYYRGIRHV